MISFGTIWVLLFAVLTSAVLDNCGIETFTNEEDLILYTPGFSRNNCSCSYPSKLHRYDINKFVGVWNYVQLYTAKPLLTKPSCMRLVATVAEDDKLIMDVEIRGSRDKAVHTSVFGFVDEESKNKARWNLYSHFSMAPSKWIFLSTNENLTLYLICGDYSDGSSAVGEIGILSRDGSLSREDAERFRRILRWNRLEDLSLGPVSQAECQWLDPR